MSKKISIINNEKMIRKYTTYIREVKGLSEATEIIFLRSIRKFNELFKKDYKEITIKSISDVKNMMKEKLGMRTYIMYMKQIKGFFSWLSVQRGYKTNLADKVDYFSLSRKDKAIEQASEIKEFPTLEYVKQLVSSITGTTEIDMRDRAMIILLCLSGIRDSAIASLPMKAIDIKKMIVKQNPTYGIKTKFAKTIYSRIFNFDKDLKSMFIDWYMYLQNKGFTDTDPLFPQGEITKDKNNLAFKKAENVTRKQISSKAVRSILKRRAKEANLGYYSPHRYRDLAVNLALAKAKTPEEMKVISQNFGHQDIATTLDCYSNFKPETLIKKLAEIDKDDTEEQNFHFDGQIISIEEIKKVG